MTVHLVPVGDRRYQLYVEIAPEEAADSAPAEEGKGWFSRQVRRFRETLKEAEQERLRRESGEPGGASGVWQWILRKMAEAIAEQRLLWHLRHQTQADVAHPDDMDGAEALRQLRAEFARDVARHRRWLLIDAGIAAVTGPVFFLVPGPNILAWYFVFRAVGHLFSWRGARKGLTAIEWKTVASAPLSRVRSALALSPYERRQRLLEIGEALGLKHLVGFVERVSARSKAH